MVLIRKHGRHSVHSFFQNLSKFSTRTPFILPTICDKYKNENAFRLQRKALTYKLNTIILKRSYVLC